MIAFLRNIRKAIAGAVGTFVVANLPADLIAELGITVEGVEAVASVGVGIVIYYIVNRPRR